ncbi:MAG: cytidine deaminase [Chloroflexi bacterium]|nr:cytidine deaminase [Chloroflexota bacterium]
MVDLELLALARDAATRAHCPYSRFRVGAVALADGLPFAGCNVENASYGLAICAERVALFSAVAAGHPRVTRLAVACVDAPPDDGPSGRMPCGACRQVMAELMPPEAIVVVDGVGDFTLADLLPNPFAL